MATNFGLPNWRRFASDAGGFTGQGGLYDPELEQQIAAQGPPAPVQPLMMRPQLQPPPPSPQEQALDARRQGIPQAPQARVPVQTSPVVAGPGPELAGPGPGQGVHLPPGPRGLSLPPDPTANDHGFDLDQMTLQAAQNAVTGMMPQPLSAETIRLAQQPVSTKRAILAGLASAFTPSQAFAPMIAYGVKGLQARKQMAEYQAAQPEVLKGIESLASTQHTMGQTANEAGKNQAEIGRIGAEANAAVALARSRNSDVTTVTGTLANAMGVPEGSEVPVAQVVEWNKSQATLNAPSKPSGDLMLITPEMAKGAVGTQLGLKPGDKVPTAVYNKLVDAKLNNDLDIVSYSDEKAGTSWRVARNKAMGQEIWRSKPESTPNRPLASASKTDGIDTPLSPDEERIAQAISKGDMNSTLLSRMKNREAIMGRALFLNPELTQQTYATKQAFTDPKGRQSQNLGTIARIVGHMDRYAKNSKALGASPSMAAGVSLSPAATATMSDSHAIATELEKLLSGGVGTIGQVQEWTGWLQSSRPSLRQAAISEISQLIGSQFEGMNQSYKAGTGADLPLDQFTSPVSQEWLKKHGINVRGALPDGAQGGPKEKPPVAGPDGKVVIYKNGQVAGKIPANQWQDAVAEGYGFTP